VTDPDVAPVSGQNVLRNWNSNGIAYEQTRLLVQQLQSNRYSDLIVCYGKDSPTLVSLSKLLSYPNADHARVRFGNEQTCHPPSVKDSGSAPGQHHQQPRPKDQAVDYVYLP
jgi:hypothetical protein